MTENLGPDYSSHSSLISIMKEGKKKKGPGLTTSNWWAMRQEVDEQFEAGRVKRCTKCTKCTTFSGNFESRTRWNWKSWTKWGWLEMHSCCLWREYISWARQFFKEFFSPYLVVVRPGIRWIFAYWLRSEAMMLWTSVVQMLSIRWESSHRQSVRLKWLEIFSSQLIPLPISIHMNAVIVSIHRWHHPSTLLSPFTPPNWQ